MIKIRIKRHITGDSWVASYNGTSCRDVSPSEACKRLVAWRRKRNYYVPGDPP